VSLEHEELTGQIIGAAIEVHKTLGPGYVEAFYDLLVAKLIVVELKAIKALDDVHFAVARSYLRAVGKEHGLLLNFAKTTLDVRRVIASEWPHR
jgi:hypothetical protein